jgi:LmbE family N-acetylglucosaminyl deacetylase
VDAPADVLLRDIAPLAVISPHLDDAVFSCGAALAAHPGSLVITVLAGAPADGARSTEWDTRCGFRDAAEAVAERRREDAAALAILGARPRWLDFMDSQYGPAPERAEIAAALATVLDEVEPAFVLYPLGLFHEDHLLVHAASRDALAAREHVPALAYEDALYRSLPGLLQKRLAALAHAGVEATPMPLTSSGHQTGVALATLKARAVAAYASQLRAFGPGGVDDTDQPERGWCLVRDTARART